MSGPYASLRGHKYMRLTTFRKNGTPVGTAVWFAETSDGALVLQTPHDTGKLKRVRVNPRVEVAPSTPRGNPLGPAVPGMVEVLTDAEAVGHASQSLGRKYGLLMWCVDLLQRLRRARWVYLRVTVCGRE